MNLLSDCIAAISTPPGKGGVSVIRLSGDGAFEIAEKIFYPKSKKRLTEYPARTLVYGDIKSRGEHIDDGLAVYFEKGSSFTGEDTVEFNCHGGVLVTRCVLEALITAGARLAGKGEFTKRAFINGKLTLTSAEAIGNLLDAKSEAQMKLAGSEARKKLDSRIAKIKKSLTDILSSAYARIDYPEEDLGDFSDSELIERLEATKHELDKLISTYRTGRAINEGINTVICGKPNVGKSTLYNLLCGEDAAIVTDISGTTRDVLERNVSLGRVMLNLADTAGIRKSADTIEAIGIERSKERMMNGELILVLFDLSRPIDEEDEQILSMLDGCNGKKVAILNKSDLVSADFDKGIIESRFDETVTVSAKENDSDALLALTDIINRLFTDGEIRTGDDAIVSSSRQYASLNSASEALGLAIDALKMGICQDAASSDVERALGALAEVDGRSVSEEVVNDIFAKFCVGK